MERRVASPAKFSIFLTMLKAFLSSSREFSTRKTKDISRDPSIHPKVKTKDISHDPSIHPKEKTKDISRDPCMHPEEKTKDISRDPSIHPKEKTKDISRDPSIHPKENIRQLLCTKALMSVEENGVTYGVHIL